MATWTWVAAWLVAVGTAWYWAWRCGRALSQVRALEAEREKLYDAVQLQHGVSNRWRDAAFAWRGTAVKLLHELNPGAADVARQAIAAADTAALIDRARSVGDPQEDARG